MRVMPNLADSFILNPELSSNVQMVPPLIHRKRVDELGKQTIWHKNS